ncbi:MAG: 3-deoxy-7-phosphoheptulonate synthase [Phycisphaerales bacterium]|nr:MAG: 3-deoxy-7-phosphoheptulonate synthase [Phycisphaerales bacterium]
MIVVMNPDSSSEHIGHVQRLLGEMGAVSCVIQSARGKIIEIVGGNGHVDKSILEGAPMVERVADEQSPLMAMDRKPGDQTHEVPLGKHAVIGGKKLAVIAGPCSVEDQSLLLEIAHAVKEAGAVGLRGGAFKPRTSPYTFQGLGEPGLEMLARAREETGLAIVTEVMCVQQLDAVKECADMLQIGSRNMHLPVLLAKVGEQDKPVLMKRGWSATFEEFILAAEYVMKGGNENVVLCERGIRAHEDYVRNTLALAIIPEVKRVSRLPIIADPSHGTGRAHLVTPMSYAAVACGADGLLIEVHVDPRRAWTDGSQSIDPVQFRSLMTNLKAFAEVSGRTL